MLNDRKAPRFNDRKFRKNIIDRALWKEWKEKTGYKLDFIPFKKIWNLIAEENIKNILEERDGVRLGAGVGEVYIGWVIGAKTKPIDYKSSLEYGKEIRHQNWDSGGKLGKIIYGTRGRKYIYKRHPYWAFKGHRLFTIAASKSMKDNPHKYKNSIEKRK